MAIKYTRKTRRTPARRKRITGRIPVRIKKQEKLKTLKNISYHFGEKVEVAKLKTEAIKRAKHYKSKWLETGDYYYKGMLDAEIFANNLTLEDLENEN